MSVKKLNARYPEVRESLVDVSRPGQVNKVISANLIDKVDDLERSDCHVPL